MTEYNGESVIREKPPGRFFLNKSSRLLLPALSVLCFLVCETDLLVPVMMNRIRVVEEIRVPVHVRHVPEVLQGAEINPKLAVVHLACGLDIILQNALQLWRPTLKQ